MAANLASRIFGSQPGRNHRLFQLTEPSPASHRVGIKATDHDEAARLLGGLASQKPVPREMALRGNQACRLRQPPRA
jgi:hypothetical protein